MTLFRPAALPLVTAFALMLSMAPIAHAESADGWAFGLGAFDIGKDFTAAEAMIEYRWEPFDLWGTGIELKPTVGLAGNDDGGVWGHVGFRWDMSTSGRWIPTLGFAVTAYEEGDGKDLGSTLQFRSSIEIAYRLDSGNRIGLMLYHLSNASLYDFNPGEESLLLTYSLGR
ncbi:MAG: acyloxyacyl hydrolase [Acidobacteriota bacterium]